MIIELDTSSVVVVRSFIQVVLFSSSMEFNETHSTNLTLRTQQNGHVTKEFCEFCFDFSANNIRNVWCTYLQRTL